MIEQDLYSANSLPKLVPLSSRFITRKQDEKDRKVETIFSRDELLYLLDWWVYLPDYLASVFMWIAGFHLNSL